MKKAANKVICGLILFTIYWLLGFMFVGAIMSALFRFDLVTEKQCFGIAVSGGILAAIIAGGITIYVINAKKKTPIGAWWSQNYPTVLLIYAMLIIFFGSARKDLIWNFAEMKDVVSLQWTIFSISIAIFLVWNFLIFEYLKKHKPQLPQKTDVFEVVKFIDEKGRFYQHASQLLNSIILLVINLLVLLVTTIIVYISIREVTVVSQNITLLSLYFCTNTILRLLLDILVPLREDKKAMLKDSKISAKDVNYQNLVDDKIEKALIAMEQIEQLNTITDEQKKDMYAEIIRGIAETANDYPVIASLADQENNQ